MALPKSTFVMGVAVLGLFGLAIREGTRAPSSDDPVDDEDRAAYEAMQARMAQEQAQRAEEATAAAKARQIANLRELYGAEAASLGPLFAGITLESPPAEADEHRSRLDEYETRAESFVTVDNHVVEIRPGLRAYGEGVGELCAALGEQLHIVWGTGERLAETGATVWRDPSTHHRASLAIDDDRCVLRFERYVDVDQWLNRSAASVVPLSLIGQSALKAEQVAGTTVDGNEIAWQVAGVGAGTMATKLVAYVEKDRVVGMTATTRAGEQTRELLAGALEKALGKAKQSDEGYAGTLSWARNPPITVEWESDDLVLVRIGKTPPP